MATLQKLFDENRVSEASETQILDFYTSRRDRALMLSKQEIRCTYMGTVSTEPIVHEFIVRDDYTVQLDGSLNTVSCDCLDFTHRGLKVKNSIHSWAGVCKHSLFAKAWFMDYLALYKAKDALDKL